MAQKFLVPVTIRELSSASSDGLAVSVTGDSNDRIKVDAGGKITWGSGSAAGDVTLYRSGADVLKTDDVFEAAAGIITLTTSGAPTASLSDGAIAVDTTNDDLYIRSGGAWVKKGGGGAVVSDTAPSSPLTGDLWFESDTGDVFVYYDSAWIDIGGTSVANIATSDTAPSSPANGDIWFETDTAKTFVWYDDGSSQQWVEIGAASSSATGSSGSIQFANGNGAFSSDGTNLFWDDTNNRLGVGTNSPAVALDVVGTTDTDYLTVGGNYVSPYTGRKNYIYNGAMQIFQRGGTVTTSSGYTLDGWRIEPVNTGYTAGINGSVTQVDDSGYAMSVRSSTTAPGFYMIEQRLEGKDVAHLAGKTVTFSFKVKRVSTTVTQGTIRVNHDDDLSGALRDETTIATVESDVTTISTSAYEQYSTSYTFPSTVTSTGYYRIGIYFHGMGGITTSSEMFRIKDVQLEEGNVQTPMKYKSYYDELRVCERYYQKGDLIPFTSGAGYYQAAGSTNFGQINTVSLRTEMRVLPSMSWSFTNVDNASLSTYYVSNKTVGLRVVAGSGSFPYFSYYASFTASAEI